LGKGKRQDPTPAPHWVAIDLTDKTVKKIDELYFIPFSNKLNIQKLYAGIRCKISASEMAKIDGANIPLVYTSLDSNFYKITEAIAT